MVGQYSNLWYDKLMTNPFFTLNWNVGLIVAVILGQSIDTPDNDRHNIYSTYTAMAHVSILT